MDSCYIYSTSTSSGFDIFMLLKVMVKWGLVKFTVAQQNVYIIVISNNDKISIQSWWPRIKTEVTIGKPETAHVKLCPIGCL